MKTVAARVQELVKSNLQISEEELLLILAGDLEQPVCGELVARLLSGIAQASDRSEVNLPGGGRVFNRTIKDSYSVGDFV